MTANSHPVLNRGVRILEAVSQLGLRHAVGKISAKPTLTFIAIVEVVVVVVQKSDSRATPSWRVISVVVGCNNLRRTGITNYDKWQ